jgi:hypothetical protein
MRGEKQTFRSFGRTFSAFAAIWTVLFSLSSARP